MSMRRSLLPLAALIFAASYAVVEAGPASGRWRSHDEDGMLEIYECGGKLCGRGMPTPEEMVAAANAKDVKNPDPALRNRPLNGIEVLQDFGGGPRVWTGGKIYRPQDGHTYNGRIELLDDNTLKLTGCVMAPLCKSIIWKRAS
jgi:uncharacterized protein (DUF2147 family)